MATVREKFHELGNWHNKISMAAVVTRELLTTGKGIAKLTVEELKQVLSKTVKNLKRIEQAAVGADKVVDEVKPFIYEKLGAETQVPAKRK